MVEPRRGYNFRFSAQELGQIDELVALVQDAGILTTEPESVTRTDVLRWVVRLKLDELHQKEEREQHKKDKHEAKEVAHEVKHKHNGGKK